MAKTRDFRRWLSDAAIRVGTDTTWVLVIVLTLSLMSSAFSIRYLTSLDSDISDLYENDIKGQTYAQNAFVDLLQIESTAKDLVIGDSASSRAASARSLAGECSTFPSLIQRATSTLNASRYKTLIARTRQDAAAVVDLVTGEIDRGISTLERGRILLGELQTAMGPLRSDIQTINDLKRGANSRGLRAVRIQLRVSLGTTIAVLLASVSVRLSIYRSQRRAAKKSSRR